MEGIFMERERQTRNEKIFSNRPIKALMVQGEKKVQKKNSEPVSRKGRRVISNEVVQIIKMY